MSEQLKVKLINPGILGEEKTIKALLGEDVEVTQMNLDGFKVMRQPQPPDFVWEGEYGLKSQWDDKGDPYPGTYTLVPEQGATATVGVVTFPDTESFKKAVPLLDFWNYHDRSRNSETDERMPEWYKYQALNLGDSEQGVTYLTEELTETNSLEPVPENYRETAEYKRGVEVMTRQAREHREGLEKQDVEIQSSK